MKFTGKIPYTLKNDYMFKAVFQETPAALKGFLSALVSIPAGEIRAVRIENPIIFGKPVTDADVCLDIRLKLTGGRLIYLELQVLSRGCRIRPSLIGMCRLFNPLKAAPDGDPPCRVMQISITDFQLFADDHTFYSQNVLMDTKTHRVYSDYLSLNVLSLKHIENAAPADHHSGLYQWGRLLNAGTWEELKMIAQNNPLFTEVEAAMKQLSEDNAVTDLCSLREFDRKAQEYGQKLRLRERRAFEQERKESERERRAHAQKLREYELKCREYEEKLKAQQAEIEHLRALLDQYAPSGSSA